MAYQPRPYHLLTPVWGDSYVRLYLEVVVPAQLAAGNLPALSDNPANRYIIFTRPADAERIRKSEGYRVLSDIMAVSIELIDEEIEIPHDTMSNCFRRGICGAEAADAAVIFLTPDLVFASGSFATLKRLNEQGADVIYIPGVRASKGPVSSRLKAYAKDGSIGVHPRRLVQLALDHLHSLADASWWEEGEGDLLPANLFWKVGKEGLLGRCFHLHPLFVAPQRKKLTFFGTVDDDFVSAACPDASRDYVVTDSDELLAIELSDPGHHFLSGFRKRSLDDVVVWAEQFTDPRHRHLFRREIRLHIGIQNSALWMEAARKATQVATAIERKLKRSDWLLIIRFEWDLVHRRAIRSAYNRRLAIANGFEEPARHHARRLLDNILTSAIQLPRRRCF